MEGGKGSQPRESVHIHAAVLRGGTGNGLAEEGRADSRYVDGVRGRRGTEAGEGAGGGRMPAGGVQDGAGSVPGGGGERAGRAAVH